MDTTSVENVKLLVQRARYLGKVLTTEPVPQRVKILSATDAGEALLLMADVIDTILDSCDV